MAGAPCRVEEVVQVGAGHVQVETTVPFKLPLSELCSRCRLGQLAGGGWAVGVIVEGGS